MLLLRPGVTRYLTLASRTITTTTMHRPRNRQPRPPRQNSHNSRGSPATPQQAAGTVPTPQQVVPGASVFIVLKEDQPTGKETFGAVAELLTRGAHPRGIKVRLQSGLVGRVQRMGGGDAAGGGAPSARRTFSHRYTDVRNDLDHPAKPPARSLADFMPPTQEEPVALDCPFCESFEGDEIAVTRHIEKEHLD